MCRVLTDTIILAQLAKEALATGVPVRKLILDHKVMTEEELDTILNAYTMTRPGISGKELIGK